MQLKSNICVSIDEIYDMRITTYMKLCDTEQFNALMNAGYGIRISDRFDKIVPYQTFLDEYAKRDKVTLYHSTTTSIVYFIHRIVTERIKDCDNNPMLSRPIVYLNIPSNIQLDEEEITVISNAFVIALGDITEVKILRKDIVTPRDWRQLRIGAVFVYDIIQYMHDLASQYVVDETSLSPDVTIYAASVHTADSKVSADTLANASACIKKELKSFANIEFIPAMYYTSSAIYAGIYSPPTSSS